MEMVQSHNCGGRTCASHTGTKNKTLNRVSSAVAMYGCTKSETPICTKKLKASYIEVLFPLPKNMRCFKVVQESMPYIKC
jgi:hypothetical protein